MYLFHFGLMALSLEPGFLDFDNLPDTNFTCVGKVIGGYYADLEANCQMFHVCTIGQADEPMDIRFLCLNGTVFDQETRVCERIDEVDCSKSEQFYSLNLELYGNSGPIIEESPEVAQETEPPSIIIKSTTSTTTTTTTTTKKPAVRPSNSPYFSTNRPHPASTSANKQQILLTHHFPVSAPDIRFNPEEINISLNPGAPPDIRTKHYLTQSFSDSNQDIVNDNVDSDEGQSVNVQNPERSHISSSTSPKSIYSINNSDNEKLPENSEVNFGFSDEEYQTELPQQRQQQFLIQTNSFRHSQSFPPNINHNSNQYHHEHSHSTTAKQTSNFPEDPSHSTLRTIYLHSLKPPEIHQHHHYTHHSHTEKPPHRVQIPIPLLQSLPPLTFSSPAPFTLQRHIENKRYTKDHQAPPRIIVSASASVSDASGRRLNYSLGTIGAAQILRPAPSSYDDYKDSDVGLDPFYHDVPKLSKKRRKRRSVEQSTEKINPFEIIKNEKEAVEVLKFLFTWYQSHQATAAVPPVTSPVSADLIQSINHELAPKDTDSTFLTDSSEIYLSSSKEPTSTDSIQLKYENSELVKKNGRYSIIGGHRNLDSKRNKNRKSAIKDSTKQSDKREIIPNISEVNSRIDDLITEVNPNISEMDSKIDDSVIEVNSNVSELNLETHHPVMEIMPNTSELKEKMDDADITVVKDLKESYFNPYDYVDDNYEGAVFNETSPNLAKVNETKSQYLNKKEEDITNITEDYSINRETISELYKYFNVNHDKTSVIPAIDIKKSKIENAKDYKSDTTSDNNKKSIVVESKEAVESHSSSEIAISEESDRLTGINVLSEVHEGEEILKSSSSSSTTTTTTTTTQRPFSRSSGIRRGRGRQRQYYSYSGRRTPEEQRSTTTFSSTRIPKTEQEYKTEIKNSEGKSNRYIEQVSTQKTQQRVRKRGRSRFTDYHSSTSTTTLRPTTIENVILKQSSEESLTTISPSSTLLIPLEEEREKNNKPEILNYSSSDKLGRTDPSNDAIITETTSEKHTKLETDIIDQTDSILEITTTEKYNSSEYSSGVENILSNMNNGPPADDFNYNDSSHQETHNISESDKNKLKSEKVIWAQDNLLKDPLTNFDRSNYQQEKDVTTIPTESNYESTDIINTDPINTDMSTLSSINEDTNYSSENKDEIEHFSVAKHTLETTENAGYLIKLLRYFADTAVTKGEKKITIQDIPVEAYEPLTENEAITEKTVVHIINPNKTKTEDIEQKEDEEYNGHTYYLTPSTTELPTLRDIYEHSKELTNDNEGTELPTNTLRPTETENTHFINNAILVNIENSTKPSLTTADFKLKDYNKRIKLKSELTETSSLIQQNLEEELVTESVTNLPLADTTATTPFVSFEYPESFGTTLSIITNPTTPTEVSTEVINEITEKFDSSTESNEFITPSEQTENSGSYHSFYDDVFFVPELTEKITQTPYDVENTSPNENTITTLILESPTSSPTTEGVDKQIGGTFSSTFAVELNSKITQTSKSISTPTPPTIHFYEAKEPPSTKIEQVSVQTIKSEDALRKLDSTTSQPDVEIQKSISLPVSVLQTNFDVSYDINNAQDINDLAPIETFTETSSTDRTTEKLEEFIQEIEATTKSVVAKNVPVKLGVTESYGVTATETIITTEKPNVDKGVSSWLYDEDYKQNEEHAVLSEVRHNATEIIFFKDTESPNTSGNDSTTGLPITVPIESSGMVNSSHLLQVVVETTTTIPVTTTISSTTKSSYHTRKTRPPKRRPNSQRSQYGRHRFSTELFTNRPEAKNNQNLLGSQLVKENITDAPLYRSASPTRSELKKISLHTTPLSSKIPVSRKK